MVLDMNRLSVVVAGVLVAGSAFTLSACGSEKPSVKEQSVAWWKTISSDVDSFQNHLTNLTTVSGYTSTSDMVAYCTNLELDIDHMQAKEPFPKDPVLWNEMLNTYERAWDSCLDQDYSAMLSYGKQGNAELEKIVVLADELHLNQ